MAHRSAEGEKSLVSKHLQQTLDAVRTPRSNEATLKVSGLDEEVFPAEDFLSGFTTLANLL